MLIACQENGKLLNAVEDTVNPLDKFLCPACLEAVRFKKGRVMRPHFAHVSLKDCHFYTENEGAEHLNLKAALFTWARKSNHAVQVEAYLPKLQQIADLLVEKQIALEVQCSSLSQKRLKERTDSYHQHGYHVLWLLGKKLWLKDSLTNLQKDFLYFSQNMGFYLWELDDKKQELRLKYLIHEDLHGRAQYKVQSFPFGQGSLLTVLRTPFQRQEMTSFLAKEDKNICRYVRQQLYYQQPKWMKLQAELYQAGDNLLTKTASDFYPQVHPVCASSFCQIFQDLTPYYQQFSAYYKKAKNKNLQVLYPPIFYAKIFGSIYDRIGETEEILWQNKEMKLKKNILGI
ncbi:competence protein CoiA [Streptococcus intermedius]|uniref:competence protein CoiA n=1 Tax=Streptococcus intermedius TaxID=1338 RepID=UPI000660B3B7|nr:competence protein CoiA family protein [Streptococcus intermedius]